MGKVEGWQSWLTEEERAMATVLEGDPIRDVRLPAQTIKHYLRSLAALREELDTWKQEFTRTLDDGRPYIQDALEAGHELADAAARMRMAEQDLAASRALVVELQERGRALMKIEDLPPSGQCEGPCPQHEFQRALALTEASMLERLEEK